MFILNGVHVDKTCANGINILYIDLENAVNYFHSCSELFFWTCLRNCAIVTSCWQHLHTSPPVEHVITGV